MSWTDPVDLYCERVAPGLAGEPLNALSNLAFFAAAYAVHRTLAARELTLRAAPDLHALWILIAAIGVGSTAFHVFAQRWAGVLDVLFIALYLHAYVAIWAHRVRGLRWRFAWLGIPAFFLFARAVDAATGLAATDPVVRGTGGYLPALFALAILAVASYGPAEASRVRTRWLLGVAAVFVASLAFRQLDLPLCDAWPYGTHFVWHTLNGFVLWTSAHAIVARRFV